MHYSLSSSVFPLIHDKNFKLLYGYMATVLVSTKLISMLNFTLANCMINNTEAFNKYIIDDIAERNGHSMLRLVIYDCKSY